MAPFKEIPLLITGPYHSGQFSSSLPLPLLREGGWKHGGIATQEDLEGNKLFGTFQWGFILRYGTKMALVALMDSLWWEQDGSSAYILALLDFLVAFNTIDHCILWGRLGKLEVGDTVLCWFTPFPERPVRISVDGEWESSSWPLFYEVPARISAPCFF